MWRSSRAQGGSMAEESSREVAWRRAARCSHTNCVEVARVGDAIAVRDSKAGEVGPLLAYPVPAWLAFLDGAKSGIFDPR
ncbi:DUF397 domain-containing protein [Cryptosporangium sp. NPDC051539]|uniref:DUF397 domain-containing protein n=1 Tax=Cryptosporangium sp. NPDC051539 TaxID=3363962 RepID=UPI0037BDE0F0